MTKYLVVALLVWVAWQFLRKPGKAAKRAAPPPPPPRPAPTEMAEAEARAVLGVDPGADADAIREAHRRLAARLHPDKGGSADLMQRINSARDLLLKRH